MSLKYSDRVIPGGERGRREGEGGGGGRKNRITSTKRRNETVRYLCTSKGEVQLCKVVNSCYVMSERGASRQLHTKIHTATVHE